MKRILLILALLFYIADINAQTFVPRSNQNVTAVDARIKAALNFYLPVAEDTTLNGGIDSVGALFFQLKDTALYARVPRTGVSGNMWAQVFKLNSSPLTSGVISFNGRTGVVTLTGVDVVSALGYTPASNATSISINGVSQDLSASRTWTVGDVRTDGTYSNPSWITSLAWSKITGAPSFGSVSSFSAGALSPLFTTSVTNSTTTPALSFTLNSQNAYTVFGRASGIGAPSFQALTADFIPSLTSSKISDFTSAARGVVSVTNTGDSGPATYNASTGVLNIPVYTPTPIGTVTTVAVGDLAPLFTSSVSNPTTTPSVSYSLSNISQYQVWGRSAAGSGAPSYVTLSSSFISDFISAVRGSISITTSGTSGASTYNSSTGVLNIPNYDTGGGGGGGSLKEPIINF